MENASKALIIAGEVLIGVLVLTLMIYIFSAFGNFSANMNKKIDEAQITEFNDHFFTYENRDNITATEIATVINFAKQSNDSRELKQDDSSEFYIRVYISENNRDFKDFFKDKDYVKDENDYKKELNKILNNFIKENNIYYFSCKGIDHDKNTKLVNKIYFTNTGKKIYN